MNTLAKSNESIVLFNQRFAAFSVICDKIITNGESLFSSGIMGYPNVYGLPSIVSTTTTYVFKKKINKMAIHGGSVAEASQRKRK